MIRKAQFRLSYVLFALGSLVVAALTLLLSLPQLPFQHTVHAGASGAALISERSERLNALSRSIRRASLETTDGVDPFEFAGSDLKQPFSVDRPVSIGARITISSDGTAPKTLVVVGVHEIGPHVLPVAAREGETPLRLVLVTTRVEGLPDARPVRFVIEVPETPVPQHDAAAQRTL